MPDFTFELRRCPLCWDLMAPPDVDERRLQYIPELRLMVHGECWMRHERYRQIADRKLDEVRQAVIEWDAVTGSGNSILELPEITHNTKD